MIEKKQLEYIKIDDVRVYERNARTHSDEQIEQICQSIKEFGFTNPILIDENNVLIAGHGRTEAAKKLGIKEAPAIRLAGLTETQIKALRIADNQLALNAGWDDELLAIELQELDEIGFDLDLTGFSFDEIENLLNGNPGADEEGRQGADPGKDADQPTNFKYEERYAVLVECKDEEEQAEIYTRLKDMGLACKVLVN